MRSRVSCQGDDCDTSSVNIKYARIKKESCLRHDILPQALCHRAIRNETTDRDGLKISISIDGDDAAILM